MAIVWIVLGAMAFWWLQQKIYEKYWDKDMKTGLRFQDEALTEGDESQLEIWVENRKFLPIPALKVKFRVSRNLLFDNAKTGSTVSDYYYRNDVLSIKPFMRLARKLPFKAARRGYYEIEEIDLVATNFFMSNEYPKSQPCYSQLYVYPRPYLDRSFTQTLQRINGEVMSKRHLLEDPFEYQGIREYSPFDTMRDINWKATARTDDLKVNVKGHTALKAVRVFLNLEDGALLREMFLLELSIRIASGVAQMFLQEGIRTSLATNGPDVISREITKLAAGAGPGHAETIQRVLARIDLTDPVTSFVGTLGEEVLGSSGQDVYTIFISPDAQPDFQELLKKCLHQGMDFAWICPRERWTELTIDNMLEKYIYYVDGEELK